MEQELSALLDASVPSDHPMYGLIRKKVEVLQGNPGWPHNKKVVVIKRMIKDMTAQ